MRTPRPSPALVVATAALVGAATGTSYAVGKYTGAQIAANAIVGKHVKNGSLRDADFSTSAHAALKGATGPRGAKGAANLVPGTVVGPAGSAGPAGASGSAGPRGATGAAGIPGAKGATGDYGATGPAGYAGAPGFAGPKGTLGLQIKSSGYTALGSSTAAYATPACPVGTVIIGSEIGPEIDQSVFRVYSTQNQAASGFSRVQYKLIRNSSAASQQLTLVSICAAYR